MSDNRKNNGGARKGAGRKPKSKEDALVDTLSAYDDLVLEKIKEGITDGDFRFIKLFMEYRHGKPTEHKEISLDNDLAQVIINLGKGEK